MIFIHKKKVALDQECDFEVEHVPHLHVQFLHCQKEKR